VELNNVSKESFDYNLTKCASLYVFGEPNWHFYL